MADSFIEDFMGELNKSSSTQNNTGNNLEWPNHTTDNYQLGNQQDTIQFGNYPYQLQLIPNDQGFVSAQQLNDLQSNSLNDYEVNQQQSQSGFNVVPPEALSQQNLNSFSSFNPAMSNILHMDENIAIINSTVQQQYTDCDNKREPKNLKNILRAEDLKQGPVFNFSDLTTAGGNPQQANNNKKQKSRSINSIINENNSNMQQQQNFTATSLNPNIVRLYFY